MYSIFNYLRKNKVDFDGLPQPLKNNYFDYLRYKPPGKKTRLVDINLVAVDFETTGLDSNHDQIISMGFCPIKNKSIRLADCLHIIINPQQDLSNENVTIHRLTDDQVNKGISQQQGLSKFLEMTQNTVLVAHYHQIERKFIQSLASKILGKTIGLTFVDTFWIAKRKKMRASLPIKPDSLRLFNLRKQYGLPNYNAHNALEDAISTAELFLAQSNEIGKKHGDIMLKDLGAFQFHN